MLCLVFSFSIIICANDQGSFWFPQDNPCKLLCRKLDSLQNTLLQCRDSYLEGQIRPLCTWIWTGSLSPLTQKAWSTDVLSVPWPQGSGGVQPVSHSQDNVPGAAQQIEPIFWSHRQYKQGYSDLERDHSWGKGVEKELGFKATEGWSPGKDDVRELAA